ncbi:MAG: Zn-ribbon domain-containing OB-fold protein [Pseudomonadales bacterium]
MTIDDAEQSWITPTAETLPFFEGAANNQLQLQQCNDCQGWMYPLKQKCQRCGSGQLDWRAASGQGTIYAHAMLHREYHPRHRGRLPLVIAWVDLAEGVRMPSNIVGSEPASLKAGLPVQVEFERDPGGQAFPVFRVIP